MVPQPQIQVQDIVCSLQVDQVFDVFRRWEGPAEVATDPVERQRLISTELASKLREEHTVGAETITQMNDKGVHYTWEYNSRVKCGQTDGKVMLLCIYTSYKARGKP